MMAIEDPARIKRLSVRMTAEERGDVQRRAKEAGLSLSAYTRRALAMYGAIREAQKRHDATKEA